MAKKKVTEELQVTEIQEAAEKEVKKTTKKSSAKKTTKSQEKTEEAVETVEEKPKKSSKKSSAENGEPQEKPKKAKKKADVPAEETADTVVVPVDETPEKAENTAETGPAKKKTTRSRKAKKEEIPELILNKQNEELISKIDKTNKLNNKCYIGQSNDPMYRWKQHKWRALQGEDKGRSAIHDALREVGIENFDFSIIGKYNGFLFPFFFFPFETFTGSISIVTVSASQAVRIPSNSFPSILASGLNSLPSTFSPMLFCRCLSFVRALPSPGLDTTSV